MDAWFLAYFIGLCGLPAQPPLLDPLMLLVVPDRIVASASDVTNVLRPGAEAHAIASPIASPIAPEAVTERPVQLVGETAVLHGQAGASKLSKSEIADIVRRKSDPIRHCYEVGLAEDEHFGGTIEVSWRIQVDGRVASANVVGATKNNAAAEECLMAEIMRWEFPPSSEPIVVGLYPIVFDAALLSRRPPAK